MPIRYPAPAVASQFRSRFSGIRCSFVYARGRTRCLYLTSSYARRPSPTRHCRTAAYRLRYRGAMKFQTRAWIQPALSMIS
eukprot:6214695-Pleurochrysis_carterae.AAC.8